MREAVLRRLNTLVAEELVREMSEKNGRLFAVVGCDMNPANRGAFHVAADDDCFDRVELARMLRGCADLLDPPPSSVDPSPIPPFPGG